MAGDLSNHEQRVAETLIGIIDYASRVLIAADYGSHYQFDKAHGLAREAHQLVDLLTLQTLDHQRSEVVKANVAAFAGRYTLGQILIDAGRLGGTA